MEVYIDITNTFKIQLNTGIQRVTKELVLRLYDYNETQNSTKFIPIVFLDYVRLWKRVTRKEWVRLHQGQPDLKRIRLSKPFLDPFRVPFMGKVPGGSIFLDMDGSWQNRLKRGPLFKKLHKTDTDIVRMHYDLVPVLFPQFCHRHTVGKYLKHLAASLTYASLFVCISRKAEEDLLALTKKLGFANDFETVVLKLGADFGVSAEKTHQTKNTKKQGLYFDPLKEKGTYLLCVGTLEPRKNHTLLIDVFEKVQNGFPWVKLVLIGKEGWNVESLVKRITEHPLYNKRLFWFVDVNDKNLNTFYEHCVLSILPSFYEGYGLSVIESLMRGKIVLCSTGGSLPEVGEGYADYFDPNNPESLKELLVGYLSSPEKRREREKTIRGFRAYTWDESASDLIRVLEAFVSKRSLKK